MNLNFITEETFNFDSSKGVLKGLAVPAEKICGDFRKIMFGSESLEPNINKKVPFFANHDTDAGKIYGKTVFTEAGSEGLMFETQLYMDRPDIMNIVNPLKDKVIKGVSIGVDIKKYEMDPKKDVMRVVKCDIKELSLTHDPAFKEAGVKEFFEKESETGFFFGLSFEERNKYLENVQDLKEISKLMKYCGFSEENTKIIISKIKSFRKEEKKDENFSEGEGLIFNKILSDIKNINNKGNENGWK